MILALKNYKVQYCNKKFFKYPDIEINERECVFLTGSSGGGKTTLLDSMLSIDFHGKVEYDSALLLGRDIKAWDKTIYGELSYMPQYAQNGLNPLITVGNQIELVIKSNTTTYENVKEYLEELCLSERDLNLFPYELSGGMKQRIVILMGFIKRLKLFIMDEPSNSVDYNTMLSIANFIKKRKDQGTAFFIVSHQEAFVRSLADKVYEL